MGGAQAIAAFAFGTRTVPKADRIVGPGNIYVAAAKKLLAGEVGIDFVAGPTEILIIAAEGDPRFLAADMLAQAEHDVDASAILLTTSKTLGPRGRARDRASAEDPAHRAGGAASHPPQQRHRHLPLARRSDRDRQRFAPEHLSIPEPALLGKIAHAGSVFVGPFSPEAAGDYASGPNHVLPTSGAARFAADFPSMDYLKVISVQQLTHDALMPSWRPRSRLWRAPKAWKRTRARWRCARVASARPAKIPKGTIRPREAVLRMAPYSPPTAGREGKLRLDFNENTVGCSPRVIEFLRERLSAGGSGSLSRIRRSETGAGADFFRVPAEQMLLTNGTDEAIQVFVNTYVNAGDEVLLLRPAYAMYRFYCGGGRRGHPRGRVPAAAHGISARRVC